MAAKTNRECSEEEWKAAMELAPQQNADQDQLKNLHRDTDR